MGSTVGLAPDGELVARLRRRDEAVFEQLVDAWSPSMLRLARVYAATEASAEDIVHEAWLGVVRDIDRFDSRSGTLRTWAYGILLAVATTRAPSEDATLPFSVLMPEDQGPTVDPSRFRPVGDRHRGHWLPGRTPQPWNAAASSTTLLDARARAGVAEALAAPPRRQLIVVTLRDVEGCTADEVCALLDVSAGDQRVILHRARAAVRAELERHFADAATAPARKAPDPVRRGRWTEVRGSSGLRASGLPPVAE